MNQAAENITRFLSGLVRRARALLLLELALSAAVCFGAAALGAAALGARGVNAPWLQSAFWAVVLLGPAVWLVRVLLPRYLPLRSIPLAAVFADHNRGVSGLASLRSAVELSAAAQVGSASLTAAAVAQAEDAARALDPRVLTPNTSARRALMALGALSAAWLVASVVAPGQVDQGLQRFFARPAPILPPQPAAALGADQGPALGDIEITLRYPDYLHTDTEIFENSTGKVVAPLGTQVGIKARVATSAEAADLAVGDAAPVAAVIDAGGRLQGGFTVTSPGHYRFLLRSGSSVEPTRKYAIEIEEDAHPTVEIEGVEDGAELPHTGGLDFGFRARDDHGLTLLSFVMQADNQVTRRVITNLPDVPDSYSGDGTWFPSEWQVKPGATVEIWLEVQDNDTVSGPKVGSSRRVKVHIASDEQRHEKTLEMKEALKEHLLTALGEHLVWGLKPTQMFGADALALQRRKAIEIIEPVLTGFRQLREAAEGDALEDAAIYSALLATQQGVVQSWDELEASMSVHLADLGQTRVAMSRAAVDGARAVDAARQHLIEGLERAVLSMESFANLQRLGDILAKGDKLRDAADELRAMLETGDADMQALLSKVDDLETQLSEMAKKMADLDQQSAAWFQNPQEQTQEMKSALDEIRELMKAGKTQETKAALEAYMQQLEEVMSGLEEMQQEEFGDVREQATRDIGNLIDGLEELEQNQARLAKDTDAVADMAEREAGVSDDQLEAAFKRAQERAAKIQVGLKRAKDASESSSAGPSTDRQLEQAIEDTRSLEAALQAKDISRALRNAEEVTGQAQWLSAEGERRGPRDPQARSSFRDGADQAAQESQALRRELEDLADRLQQARQRGAAQSQGVADRQSGLQRDTSEIGDTLKEFSQDSPYVPAEWSEALQQATQNMQAASDKLRQGSLRGASQDQRAAEATLRDIRQQMEQARDTLQERQNMAQQQGQGKPGQQQGQGQPGEQEGGQAGKPQGGQPGGEPPGGMAMGQQGKGKSGPGQSEDWGGTHRSEGSVRILQQGTGAEDYRKALMEGMRGETPERYQRQNRAYYERLVE